MLSSPHTSNAFERGGSAVGQPGFLLSLDPPDHTRIRRMLTREFSVKRMTALRPRVEEIVTTSLDDMLVAGPPADLMQSFALPVPSLVICELLGVPYEDRADFQRRSDVLLDPAAGPERQRENTRETNEYMADLVARHRKDPGEDILGMLIREHPDDVSDEELVGIGNILLIAGHETTANTLGLGTLLLSQHPRPAGHGARRPDRAAHRGRGDPALPVDRAHRLAPSRHRGHHARRSGDRRRRDRRRQPPVGEPRHGLPPRRRRLRRHAGTRRRT